MASPGRSDADILKEFNARLSSSEKHMSPIMERVRRARSVAAGTSNPNHDRPRDEDDPTDWHSRLFPPIAREKWELKNAELIVEAPRVDFVAYDPRYEDNAAAAEDSVAYHYDRDNFSQMFRHAMRAATRDGGAVIKTTWANQTEVQFDDDGLPVLNTSGDFNRRVKYSGVRNNLCRLEDIFPDPAANTFRTCRWVTHRSYATTDDLKSVLNKDGTPFYDPEAIARLSGMGGADGSDQKRDGETQEAYQARRHGVHTIHEQWTPYSRLTVANRSVIIRRDDRLTFMHGCVPFTMIRTIEDEDCIVGVSMLNLIDSLQESYWSLFNGLIDAVKLTVNPPMIADTEEDPGAAKQVIYPGCVLSARQGQQTLKVMQDVAQLSKYDLVNLLSMHMDLMDRVSGMNAALAGVSNAQTATEAAINVRQGKGRVGFEMLVSDDAWVEVSRKTYCLIRQFQSDEVTATLSSGRATSFKPEQLVDMMVVPRKASSERALKDLERQDKQTIWEIAQGTMTDPTTQMPQVDYTKAFQGVWEAFGGDPRDVAPPPGNAALPPAPEEAGMAPAEPDLLDEAGNPIDPAILNNMPDPTVAQPRPEQVGGQSGFSE